MDGLLTEIKSVKRVQNNIDKFESLSLEERTKSRSNSNKSKRSVLDITSSSSSDAHSEPFDLQPSIASSQTSLDSKPATKKHKRHDSTAFLQRSYLEKPSAGSLPDDAREILRSQPDQEDLIAVLQYLQYGIDGKHDFNIHLAGPKKSQLINILVTVTIPDQWHPLRSRKLSSADLNLRKLLLSVLQSVPGIGALSMQLRNLSIKKENRLIVEDMLSVLTGVLSGSHILHSLLQDASRLYQKDTQRRVFWLEAVGLLCGSKVLAAAAQAFVINSDLESSDGRWLSEGVEYSTWLGKNIATCATNLTRDQSESWNFLSQAMKRAMSLGYRNSLVASLYSSLLLQDHALWTPLQRLLQAISDHDQRAFFDGMLQDLVRKYLRNPALQHHNGQNGLETEAAIGGVAAMIAGLVENNAVLEEHVEHWLTTTSGDYVNLGLDTRRAVVATLGLRQDKLQKILEKCLESFGDKLQIKHSPILQQESMAQIILLAISYLHRSDIEIVRKLSKSGLFLQCVSNRLAASVPRARVLGMTVATAVSRLVDPADKVMNFGSEEMEEESVQNMLSLVHVNDKVGKIQELTTQHQLKDIPVVEEMIEELEQPRKKKTFKKATPKPQSSKIISIEEVDDEEDEEDDLIPYNKPEDDPSDSDDDPTLINRSKPSAPVYIIDLIRQLQTDDKPEVLELALQTAPELIRRKATFGTELSDNVQVLASTLLNLKDPISDSTMHSQRLSSLIACLVSAPSTIGPWLCSTYFEADLTLTQRATILTVLGLGARSLSGHDDSTTTTQTPSNPPSFPSKQLPPSLHALYTPTTTLASTLTNTTLQPLAAKAADTLTGPNILKIRTFSSRLAVQRAATEKAHARSKRIPKNLHALLSSSIYLPLCRRLTLVLSSNSFFSHSTLFDPSILRLLLQTLTITLHTLGPHALQLPDITHETLTLLISLHNQTNLSTDALILPALLQLLLTTIDLNVEAGRAAEERLIGEYGAMVNDLVSWAGGLVEAGIKVPILEGEGEGGGMPWTVLVAGVQVKWFEIGRKFQGRMLGLMGGEFEGFG